MSRSDPWEDIGPDTLPGTFNARRVDPSHPHDFFWGRDAQGHRLLMYKAESLEAPSKVPSLRGISVEVASDNLILRLMQQSDLEMFSTLCWSLIERTRQVPAGDEVLGRVFAHLERWQRFLAKGIQTLLGGEQVRGLFCELKFLERELMTRFGASAVQFWRGPAGDPQDFAVGTTLFEIKSHAAGSAPVLMISSADQLWHSAGELFVVGYTIGEATSESRGAESLAGLVGRLRSLMESHDMADMFDDRLLQVGYTDHPDYALAFYAVSEPEIFRVEENFPRITKGAVMPGVCRVRYGIELSACMPFKAEPDWNSLGAVYGN